VCERQHKMYPGFGIIGVYFTSNPAMLNFVIFFCGSFIYLFFFWEGGRDVSSSAMCWSYVGWRGR
jgi:hypothetical protein